MQPVNVSATLDRSAIHGIDGYPALSLQEIADEAVQVFERHLRCESLGAMVHYEDDAFLNPAKVGYCLNTDSGLIVLAHREHETEIWNLMEARVPMPVFRVEHLELRMSLLAERVSALLKGAKGVGHGILGCPQKVEAAVTAKGQHFRMRAIQYYDINIDAFPTRFDVLFGTTTQEASGPAVKYER